MNHFEVWLKEEGLTVSRDPIRIEFAVKVWNRAVDVCKDLVYQDCEQDVIEEARSDAEVVVEQ